MAKLVTVGVQVPDTYPENSPVEVVYPTPYWAAARAAGGMVEGKLGAASGGYRPLLSKSGGPLLVYGGELGDPLPPLVQVRVKPRGVGVRGVDWHIEGHPRDTGGDAWDGSKIGEGNSGQTIVTEAQRARVEDITASFDAAQLDLSKEKAAVAQALADTAQAAAQAIDLGTQALEQAGRIPVATFAELGANHADAALGTWGYTADTRISYRKESPGADGWVLHGEGAAGAGELAEARALLDETRAAPGFIPAGVVNIRRGQDIKAQLTEWLNVNRRAIELPDGDFYLTGEQLIINERPLRGLRPGDTRIFADMADDQPAMTINTMPTANGFRGRASVMASDVELIGARDGHPNWGDKAHAFGVLQQGAHVLTKNLKIRGFGIGYLMTGSHNYLSGTDGLHVYVCHVGLKMAGEGYTNYGENIVHRYGVLHDNFTNLEIETGNWFVELDQMSLDYPVKTQIHLGARQHAFTMRGGHIEHHRFKENNFFFNGGEGSTEYPVYLIDSPPGLDAGVITIDGTRLVVFERRGGAEDDPNSNPHIKRFNERTIDELVSPNVGAITLVFRNCIDAVGQTAEPVHRVMQRGRPLWGVEKISEGNWLPNETWVAMRVRLRIRFAAGTTGVRGYEVLVSDKGGARERPGGAYLIADGAQGGMTVTADFTVQANERFKLAKTDGVTAVQVDYELLP